MTISIIIPVYNVAPYLRACVESVLAQTYRDLEIILVDDGSADDSGALCDQLAQQDSRIRAIHQANQGLSGARNTGLRAAHGEYIAFLDGDDVYLDPDALAQMHTCLLQDVPDLLLFRCVDIYPNHRIPRPLYDTAYFEQHSAPEIMDCLVRTQSFMMSACFLLIHRDLLIRNSLFFEPGLLSEDVDWSLRLWRHARCVRAVNIPLYGYQHREGSITTSYSLRNLRSYDTIFRLFADRYAAEQQNAPLDTATHRYWRTVFGYLAQMYVSCLYRFADIPRADRREAYSILKHHRTLLEHSISAKSDRARRLQSLLGFRGMLYVCALYGLLKQLRSKLK